MPLVRDSRQASRFAGRMATAVLLATGSIVGADAQDSTGGAGSAGSAGSVVSIVEAGEESTLDPDGSDVQEVLFSDGPREPSVLSAEGTLIGSGARKLESRAEGDAVATLVAAVGVGANAPDSGGGGELEELEEPAVEETREPSPSLLEKIGGFLGLGGN